ncbi:MAG: hypothetical protein HYS23_06820 [Geobacter sp.]|nr:hypothetical protein [Geobacter sp.]
MTQEKDERKRPNLRLVVNNPEKRVSRPAAGADEFISLEELYQQQEAIRPDFYRDMEAWQAKAYTSIERFLNLRDWPYGLDPHHGRLLVLPAALICPEMLDHGASQEDELLIYVTEDATGQGLCLSLEAILPYYSDDEAVMEDAILFAPILQYGSLFLEENRHDGMLDIIYRLAFPLYPPALTEKYLDRMFNVAAQELSVALQGLGEFPE